MLWVGITIVLCVLFVCECIVTCIRYRYKYQDKCCCDTCPYRDECYEEGGAE